MPDTNSPQSKPELIEIAHTRNGKDITRAYINELQIISSQDTMLDRAGGLEGYDRLLRDDQVSATFAQRRHAVISRPWSVTPGGNKRQDKLAAKMVEDTLNLLDWDTITDHMLYARFHGFGAAEILWQVKGGQLCIQDIRVRNRRRFGFAGDFELRLLTTSNPMGEPVPERKFWVASVGASHADEPYGLGLGHALYWPVFFKRSGARFWATYLEKYGAPTAMGTFRRGTEQAERNTLLQALQSIATEAGIIVPEGVEVKLLEASRGGNAGYETWMNYWDGAIAKIVLGQTMTTDNGSSYSQASVHYDVRQDIVAADADLVCQSANNSWVKWLIDYNLPGAAYPHIWRDMEDAEDLKERSNRDKALFELGYKLKEDAVARVYGDDYEIVQPPEPEPEQSQPEPDAAQTAPTEKAEPRPIGFRIELAEPDDLPNLPITPMAEQLEKEAAPAWSEIMAHVQQLVDTAPDLPTLRDQLLNAYATLPETNLPDVMSIAFSAANLAGRYDVDQESKA